MMEAMNHECCQWFAGPEHTLEEFQALLVRLIQAEQTQYSYLNTIVCRSGNDVAGIAVSYDGGQLHQLRQPFIDACLEAFGRDHSNIPDETEAGELYLDTLCVDSRYRGHGIGRRLIAATIEKGRTMNLPVGLLVDDGNPRARKLYESLGFQFKNANSWGGHSQRHLAHALEEK